MINVKTPLKVDVAEIVDQLGNLRSKIAELIEQETELKTQLKALGNGAFNGNLFKATVASFYRSTLDSEMVTLFLTDEQFKACLKTTEVTTVKVTARTRT